MLKVIHKILKEFKRSWNLHILDKRPVGRPRKKCYCDSCQFFRS